MSENSEQRVDPLDDTGVAEVRTVREKIAARHKGDLRGHAAETDRIVEPLIQKLGLKQGVPLPRDDRRSGTAG